MDEEQEPGLASEDSESRVSSKRRSSGGLLAVLGLIVPVVLGGVTVFGIYFLFLEDYLRPPKHSNPKTKNSTTKADSETGDVSVPPPQPTFAETDSTMDSGDPQPDSSSEPRNTINELAQRERDAANALKLAQKMWEVQPMAAESWYRKVVTKYPNTRAAETASDWLKRRDAEP